MTEVDGSLGQKCKLKHKHRRTRQTGIKSASTDNTPDSAPRGVDLEMASQSAKGRARGGGDKKEKEKRKRRREEVREEKEEKVSGAVVVVVSSHEEDEEQAVEEEHHEAVRICTRRRPREAEKKRTVVADEDANGQESHRGNQAAKDTQDGGGGSGTPETKRSRKRAAALAVGADMDDEKEEAATPHKKRKTSTCANTKIVHGNGQESVEAGERDGHSQAEEAQTKRQRVVKNAQEVALEYLHLWNTDRKQWSFRKKAQYWLLQNLYDKKQVRIYIIDDGGYTSVATFALCIVFIIILQVQDS